MSRWSETQVKSWAAQPLWWSERQRSKTLLWPAGEQWFSNDPLGPQPHTHPDASEIYVVAHGTLSLQVGRTSVLVEAGGFCLIPPDTFHHPNNPEEVDLCMLALVSPNLKPRRWKTAPFTDSDYLGTPLLGSVDIDGELPGTEQIQSQVVSLDIGQRMAATAGDPDTTLWVLQGALMITVGPLSGPVETAHCVIAMASTPWSVTAAHAPARLLVVQAFGSATV